MPRLWPRFCQVNIMRDTHMSVKHKIDWQEVGRRIRTLRTRPQVEVSEMLGITRVSFHGSNLGKAVRA